MVARGIKTISLFLLAMLVCASPQVFAQEKTPIGALAQELGLTMEQTMLLKEALTDFSLRKNRITNSDASDDEKIMQTKMLQRQLFEELNKFLTPGQVEGYTNFIKGIKRDAPPPSDKKEEAEETGQKALQVTSANFPWFTALRQGLKKMDLSGLQRQAAEELFKDLEQRAVQMSYWEPNYDPAEDTSITGIFNSKMQWILNMEQFTRYMEILSGVEPEKQVEAEGAGKKEQKPSTETGGPKKEQSGGEYYIEELEETGVLIDRYEDGEIIEDN